MINVQLANSVAPGLCANLAQGLHAAAQPLTILLAGLCKENTRSMQTEELRELTASSWIEVQRVCGLFGSLQQLVLVESAQPNLSLISLAPLLLQVAAGLNPLFEQDGLHLHTQLPKNCPPLFLDRARTTQAFANVLSAAHAVSAGTDTIELAMTCSGPRSVRIVVCNENSAIHAMAAELSLAMAVAEANIRSQQGVFLWSLRPFRVHMELQHAQIPGI